ncbi:hypothetical protein AX15_003588 [Amanita polypyramis BW_CC]|nr:hypothetical protein AX15_003588 [Amanita polypyramis BW_CC]
MSDVHEEEDTCRICSTPGTDEQPLFYPCKCSGTIRYIHQDCLTTWLAHSKKRRCDLCNHPFSFTKVYAPNMPSALPAPLLLRRLAQQVLYGALFGIRAIFVATIWLAALPWLTLLAWRFYFAMGEATAWWISNRPRSESDEIASLFYYVVSADNSNPLPTSFLSWLMAHPLWRDLPADIFTGQIIASVIVLTFVAVFLLREWISQNARPGVFEDDDFPVEEQPPQPIRGGIAPPPPLPPPPIQPRPAIQNVREPNHIHPQQQVAQQHRPLIMRPRNEGHRVGEARRRRSPAEPKGRGKGKMKQLEGIGDLNPRSRRRAHRAAKSPAQSEAFTRRVHEARASRQRSPRSESAPLGSTTDSQNGASQDNLLGTAQFEFTFRPIQLQPPEGISPSIQDETGHFRGRLEVPMTEIQDVQLTDTTVPVPDVANPFASIASISQLSESEWSSIAQSSPDIILGRVAGELISEQSSDNDGSSSRQGSVYVYNTPSEYSQSRHQKLPVDETEAEAGPSGLSSRHEVDDGFEGEQGASEGIAVEGAVASNADVDDMSDTRSESDIREEHDQYFTLQDDEPGETEMNVIVAEHELVERGVGNEFANIDQHIERHLHQASDEDDEEEDEEGVEEDEEDDGDVAPVVDDEGAEIVQDDAVGADLNENGIARDAERAVAAGEAAAGADANDEMEGNVEDDMEGAMEAIGMRGPILGVFQNAALMVFILDTAIGIGVWAPFTVGKSAALLSLDPQRTLQLLHLPIRAIRIITDPIVDLVVYLLVELLFPSAFRTFCKLARVAFSICLTFLELTLGKNVEERMLVVGTEVCSRSQAFLINPWERIVELMTQGAKQSHPQPDTVIADPSFITTFLTDIALKAEPYFAALGKEVRLGGERFKDSWLRLALGHGPTERLFAVSLGYIIFGVAVAVYLNILTVGTARSAGRAVRSAVRQQLLVVKVAAFIFIELVTFPFGCGIVLDLSTIRLFPEVNLHSRMSFFAQAPLTAVFYHWVAGTLFMYAFAVLLSGCRSVMRPGAMWFIKDPQDQNSHPIRDILDRPALTQLRKIGISAVMYSAMVVCVVGSVAGLLVLGDKSIMPFRWKNREPLSHVPVDLLFLHLVLPYTMRYFRPKKVVKRFATAIWKHLAAKLRLTSYFFGGRHPSEEYTPKTWREVFTQSPDDLADAEHVFDGSFRRVPATDQLALPRDMKATAPVTAVGEPVDEEARNLIRTQDAEASKAHRDVKTDYMVVYIPPQFRYRIFGFIGLMWWICAMLLGLSVALPIQLGRSFFRLFTPREIHDGYSFIVGFYLLWLCYIIGKAIDRLDKRRQRRGNEGPRADIRIFVIKRGLLWFAKTIYMVLFLGIIIPTLIALVVDLYIILPLRLTLKPNMTPRIRIVDAWALGLLYAKIVIHVHRIHPPNQITRGLQRIMENGWTHPDPVTATKEVIAPLVAGLLGMIVVPVALFKLAYTLFPRAEVDGKFIFMHVYPGIFVFIGLMRSSVVLYDILSTWSQTIRDKEFLVEMRLMNHNNEKPEAKDTAV